MENKWQAELNNIVNSNRKLQGKRLSKLNISVILLVVVFAIPAVVSGLWDQRSRAASEKADIALKMNLNVPICSSEAYRFCGIIAECVTSEEGKICEHARACQNSKTLNDVFVCKKGRWVYTTSLEKGYCSLCREQEQRSALSLSPTVFQGPTPDTFLHRR